MLYRVAIVEDSPAALSSLLNDFEHFTEIEVVLVAINGDDYLSQLKRLSKGRHPQVVLMDIEMPIMDGIKAVSIGNYLYPYIQYIMLTVVADDDKLFEAIKAGAHGYLLKEESITSIISAIHEVIDLAGAPMSPQIARKALKLLMSPRTSKAIPTADPTLTGREIEVLKRLVEGDDYREIAAQLFISPNTVRKHIANIYGKLHITSIAQAVKLAIKNDWILPD